MTTPAQVRTAAVLRDVVQAVAGASGHVYPDARSRPYNRSAFYEVRASGFHVCLVEIALDGRLLTSHPKE